MTARAVDLAWARPTRVDLDDARLRWTWADPAETPPMARAGPELLADFIDLVDAPADGILRFARRWGVLTFCAHGLPVIWRSRSRRPLPPAAPLTLLGGVGKPIGAAEFARQEVLDAPSRPHRGTMCAPLVEDERPWAPLKWWRRWARKAAGLVEIAKRLRTDEPVLATHWRDAFGFMPRSPSALVALHLATGVNVSWLEQGTLRTEVELRADGRGFDLAIWPTSLFSALAVQLALHVVGGADRGAAHCSGCGRLYVPKRRPQGERRRYCGECRALRIPQRDAARALRARRAEAVREPHPSREKRVQRARRKRDRRGYGSRLRRPDREQPQK